MIQVRKAQDSDLEPLELLFLEVRQKTFFWKPSHLFAIQDFRKDTQGEEVYIAENEHKNLLGFISVWKGDHPFIHHLYVLPSSQKKGVGTLLVRHLFLHFPLPYRLKCLVKNREAIRFYAKTGWNYIEEGEGDDGSYLLLELNCCSSFFTRRTSVI